MTCHHKNAHPLFFSPNLCLNVTVTAERNCRGSFHCPSFQQLALRFDLGAFFFGKDGIGCAHGRVFDKHLKEILQRTKVVAVVGVSMNPVRPSYYVARYLSLKGFTVIPVNPGHAGKALFGQTVRASLSEISEPVDMVDIFRRSEAVPPIVDEALDAFPNLQTVWMQIGVENADAAAKAQARGVDVVMNR